MTDSDKDANEWKWWSNVSAPRLTLMLAGLAGLSWLGTQLGVSDSSAASNAFLATVCGLLIGVVVVDHLYAIRRSLEQPGATAAPAPAAVATLVAMITTVGPNKIALIKVMREVTGLDLAAARLLVEHAPRPFVIPKDQAAAIQKQFEAAGATLEIPSLPKTLIVRDHPGDVYPDDLR